METKCVLKGENLSPGLINTKKSVDGDHLKKCFVLIDLYSAKNLHVPLLILSTKYATSKFCLPLAQIMLST